MRVLGFEQYIPVTVARSNSPFSPFFVNALSPDPVQDCHASSRRGPLDLPTRGPRIDLQKQDCRKLGPEYSGGQNNMVPQRLILHRRADLTNKEGWIGHVPSL
jgi:hypothetical protein